MVVVGSVVVVAIDVVVDCVAFAPVSVACRTDCLERLWMLLRLFAEAAIC